MNAINFRMGAWKCKLIIFKGRRDTPTVIIEVLKFKWASKEAKVFILAVDDWLRTGIVKWVVWIFNEIFSANLATRLS